MTSSEPKQPDGKPHLSSADVAGGARKNPFFSGIAKVQQSEEFHIRDESQLEPGFRSDQMQRTLEQGFDDLYNMYSAKFRTTDHSGATQKDLIKNLRETVPNVRGVYVVRLDTGDPLYIGSSGKIEKGARLAGQKVWQRLANSTTPYHIDVGNFRYGPTTSGVPPADYTDAIKLDRVRISVIETPPNIAPSVLEHLLLQGHFNQYGDLPPANRRI